MTMGQGQWQKPRKGHYSVRSLTTCGLETINLKPMEDTSIMRVARALKEEGVRALPRRSCMLAVTRIMARMLGFSTLMRITRPLTLIEISALASAVEWICSRDPVAGRYVSGKYVDPITLGSFGEQRGKRQQLFGF